MATVAERLSATGQELAYLSWESMRAELQKEAAPTVFVRVTMAPAPTVLNLWASKVLHGDGAPNVEEVLASPDLIDADTKQHVPDPPLDSHLQSLRRLAYDSAKTYQADPYKYAKGGDRERIEALFLGATVIVEGVLTENRAPDWFWLWLLYRWPDSGKYARTLSPHADHHRDWVEKSKARRILGGFGNDKRALTAATSVVREADRRFMRALRDALKPV